ncbi:hypothetical protein KP509_21G057700 [Ceratopteris richardii]|uniref:NADH dehydrogenase [ubiquinone] 1 alpha subcomplex subunit 6 n=1 Tax=Ceratopteris richardii TaxID=49495 RepID=A0A8T2SC55_CERRI|nr:hypothetical protein KP509_21G057700 [Ceratopteris richardii]
MAYRVARRGMATLGKDVSRNMEEAKHKALSLFKDSCRALPAIMDIYILQDTVSLSDLRSRIASEFRKHEGVKNPQVADLLIFKGQEELNNILTQSKQRHHIITQYVVGTEGMVQPLKLGIVDHDESDFLRKFYVSNRT